MFLSEAEHYGTGQSYQMVLSVLREEGLGWYFWELMVGRSPFARVTAIFYPTGKVRSCADLCAVLRFQAQELFVQHYPLRRMDEEELTARFEEALATPTTPWNLERRLELIHSAGLVHSLVSERHAAGEPAALPSLGDLLVKIAKETGAAFRRMAEAHGAGDVEKACQLMDDFLKQRVTEAGLTDVG